MPNKAVRLTPTLLAELVPLATLAAISAGWHPFDSTAAAKATLVLAATVARFTDGLVPRQVTDSAGPAVSTVGSPEATRR